MKVALLSSHWMLLITSGLWMNSFLFKSTFISNDTENMAVYAFGIGKKKKKQQ